MNRLALVLLLAGCAPQTFDSPVYAPPGGTTAPVVPPTEPGGTNTANNNGGGQNGPTEVPCPTGVICVDSLPFGDNNTTIGAPSDYDSYSCSPGTDESGPEVRYRVTLSEPGFLAASLHDLPAGVDVDVHVLDADDPTACVDRGHWDAAALLSAGDYWVVVDSWVDGAGNVYDGDYTLQLTLTRPDEYVAEGLAEHVLEAGLLAFDRAWQEGQTHKLEYAIMDYSLPSTTPRMFVLDLRWGGLLFRELATHGSGSQDPNDITMAANPSNIMDSNASSMGLVRAAEPYYGSQGYSLKLDGLEVGYNDQDRPRGIVIHGADYATQEFVNAYGYLGRSWGCPAVAPDVNEDLIATLRDGGLFLKYWDHSGWLASSDYVAP